MERADQGADEAARLDEGGQRRQHAQSHRPPDPRDEHHTALPQGGPWHYYTELTRCMIGFSLVSVLLLDNNWWSPELTQTMRHWVVQFVYSLCLSCLHGIAMSTTRLSLWKTPTGSFTKIYF